MTCARSRIANRRLRRLPNGRVLVERVERERDANWKETTLIVCEELNDSASCAEIATYMGVTYAATRDRLRRIKGAKR